MSAALTTAPAAEPSETRTALALAVPALMLFVGVVVIPLAMTVMLSFHDWANIKASSRSSS